MSAVANRPANIKLITEDVSFDSLQLVAQEWLTKAPDRVNHLQRARLEENVVGFHDYLNLRATICFIQKHHVDALRISMRRKLHQLAASVSSGHQLFVIAGNIDKFFGEKTASELEIRYQTRILTNANLYRWAVNDIISMPPCEERNLAIWVILDELAVQIPA